MIIKIISIGNKLNTWEQDSINFYLKQLPKNLKIEFVNLKSHQNPNYSESEVIKKE
jgi:23S rRNA pseudoU1915 N3-methylase RlmH